MIEYYEEQLDLTKHRITEIEKNISLLQESMMTVSEQIRDTQRYLIKVAHNQAEIAKRISSWPYIAVPDIKGDDNV
jgi:phage shock protein A